MIWATVLGSSLGCYLLKLAGLSVPDRVLRDERVQRIAALLPITLLAALAAVGTFASNAHLTVDARVAGLAVAAVLVWRRAPFALVVVAAAATAAILRVAVP